jgi:hypothetical protein
MRRGRINTHNRLSPPDTYSYVQLSPARVREAVEAFDNMTDNEQAPAKVKELFLVLSIEVEQLDNRE